MLITEEWLRSLGIRCEEIKDHPSITINKLLVSSAPSDVKIWVMLNLLTPEQLEKFSRSYLGVSYDDWSTSSVSRTMRAAYLAGLKGGDVEYGRQIDWLKETLMPITRNRLRKQCACYNDEDIDRRSVDDLLALPIPDWDKICVLYDALPPERKRDFAKSCAEAANEHALEAPGHLVHDYARRSRDYAESGEGLLAAYWANVAAEQSSRLICSNDTDRQINWLKERL